jgi:predicted nucleic-acid-binding Zn-ribbon protein
MATSWQKCPKCGSEELIVDTDDEQEDTFWRTVICWKCKFKFTEVWQFLYNENPDTLEKYDKDGNIRKP